MVTHLVNLLGHRSRRTKRYAECHLTTRRTAMFAIRQIHNDPAEVIPVPPELRHRKTEVIFIALEDPIVPPKVDDGQQTTWM